VRRQATFVGNCWIYCRECVQLLPDLRDRGARASVLPNLIWYRQQREMKGRTWCPLSGQRCEWRRRRSGHVRHRSDPPGRCGLSPEAGGFWGVCGDSNILAGADYARDSYCRSGVGFRIGPCECLTDSSQRTSKIREARNTIGRAWGAPEPTLPDRPIDRHSARQIRSRLEIRVSISQPDFPHSSNASKRQHGGMNQIPSIGQSMGERSLSGRYRYPNYEVIAEYNTPTNSTSPRAQTRILITHARTQ